MQDSSMSNCTGGIFADWKERELLDFFTVNAKGEVKFCYDRTYLYVLLHIKRIVQRHDGGELGT